MLDLHLLLEKGLLVMEDVKTDLVKKMSMGGSASHMEEANRFPLTLNLQVGGQRGESETDGLQAISDLLLELGIDI